MAREPAVGGGHHAGEEEQGGRWRVWVGRGRRWRKNEMMRVRRRGKGVARKKKKERKEKGEERKKGEKERRRRWEDRSAKCRKQGRVAARRQGVGKQNCQGN